MILSCPIHTYGHMTNTSFKRSVKFNLYTVFELREVEFTIRYFYKLRNGKTLPVLTRMKLWQPCSFLKEVVVSSLQAFQLKLKNLTICFIHPLLFLFEFGKFRRLSIVVGRLTISEVGIFALGKEVVIDKTATPEV